MHTTSLVLITVIAGCSKASAPPPTETGSPQTAPAVAAPAPPPAPVLAPCPDYTSIDKTLAAIFKSADDSISNPVCIAGRFPAPAWYVSANVTNDEGGVDLRTAIVDASGAIVTSTSDDVPPGLADASGTSNHQAIDFDQDGVDEILYVDKSHGRGYASATLIVLRLAQSSWERVLGRSFEYSNAGAVDEDSEITSCDATWAVDKRTITFTPTGKVDGSDADSCVLANETWMFVNGKFAKTVNVAARKD
jgi:hypothetical protein